MLLLLLIFIMAPTTIIAITMIIVIVTVFGSLSLAEQAMINRRERSGRDN
jgi:hypothetical protein